MTIQPQAPTYSAMPSDPSADRRRLPRVTVEQNLECRLEVRTRVRLLDISLTGTLL
jgi:hypothetical protein